MPEPRFTSLSRRIAILTTAASLLSACAAAPAQWRPDNGANSPNNPVQIAVPALNFDVVSVKENKSSNGIARLNGPADGSDGITVTDLPLFSIILQAYYFHRPNLVSGLPDWTRTVRYDIQAKVTDTDIPIYQKLTQTERWMVFQKVLADRFKLKVERDLTPMPVYALVIAKGGIKFKPSNPDDPNGIKGPNGVVMRASGFFRAGPGQFRAQAITITSFALMLSTSGVDRPVVDKTGLTGTYDFTFNLAPEAAVPPTAADIAPPPPDDSSGPSIFTAVQEQLGLKLQPDTAPVERLVIDHVERPSADD